MFCAGLGKFFCGRKLRAWRGVSPAKKRNPVPASADTGTFNTFSIRTSNSPPVFSCVVSIHAPALGVRHGCNIPPSGEKVNVLINNLKLIFHKNALCPNDSIWHGIASARRSRFDAACSFKRATRIWLALAAVMPLAAVPTGSSISDTSRPPRRSVYKKSFPHFPSCGL